MFMAARAIAFGYPVAGLTVEIIIQRIADGFYWTGSDWAAVPPAPALSMTYDAVMRQYYTEEQPTAKATWTAFEMPANEPIYFDNYGGGFPEIATPPSAAAFLMSEVVNRIRTQIRDTAEDNFEDAELLSYMDMCHEWLMEQCIQQRAAIGYKTAIYTGDGTTQWGWPADYKATRSFVGPNQRELVQSTPEEYDRGQLAQYSSEVGYYARDAGYLLFMPDLPSPMTTKLRYYYRPAKLTIDEGVPFDGVFMNLMTQWGTVSALSADEFALDLEGTFFSMFMDLAQQYIDKDARQHFASVSIPKRAYLQKKSGKQTGRDSNLIGRRKWY